MAKLPILRRLSIEDFRDAPEWFANFIGTLNPFLENIYTALAGNLTVADNIVGMYKTLRFVAGAAAINNTHKFLHTLKTKAKGCVVVQVSNVTSGAVNTSAVWCDWYEEAGQIVIRAVTGLTTGTTYNVTFRVE